MAPFCNWCFQGQSHGSGNNGKLCHSFQVPVKVSNSDSKDEERWKKYIEKFYFSVITLGEETNKGLQRAHIHLPDPSLNVIL